MGDQLPTILRRSRDAVRPIFGASSILVHNAHNRLLPRVTYGEDYLHVVSWDEGRVSGRA